MRFYVNIRIICLAFLLCAGQGRAYVREIQSIEEIIEEITNKTLVIFDIDNTVLKPATERGNDEWLGSDQWFYFLLKILQEHKRSPNALREAEQIWNRSQSYINTKPVEPSTPALIAGLQKKGVKVIALTARSHAIAPITRQQLFTNGIDFALNPLEHEGSLKIDDYATYERGIVYQGEGNDKGTTLVNLLEKLEIKPQKIIFIDDKLKNTVNVHNALQANRYLDHIEYRYGFTDKSVAAFNEAYLHAPTALTEGYLESLPF